MPRKTKMDKYLKIIIGLCLMVGVVSCTSIQTRSVEPFEFKDTGNDVDNYKLCYENAKKYCESISSCTGVNTDSIDIICDNGKCIC